MEKCESQEKYGKKSLLFPPRTLCHAAGIKFCSFAALRTFGHGHLLSESGTGPLDSDQTILSAEEGLLQESTTQITRANIF